MALRPVTTLLAPVGAKGLRAWGYGSQSTARQLVATLLASVGLRVPKHGLTASRYSLSLSGG